MKRTRWLYGILSVFLCVNLSMYGLSMEASAQGQSGPEFAANVQGSQEESQKTTGQRFYKWRDAEGNLFLTDDPEKVPMRFRDEVEVFELLPPQEVEEPQQAMEQPLGGEAVQVTPPRREERASDKSSQTDQEPDVYKEVPFDQFIRIRVGMDEAEVLSRLGFPSLVTPSGYFSGERSRYEDRIIRLIYLGDRERNQKTTVVEIRNGRVVDVERIFPF